MDEEFPNLFGIGLTATLQGSLYIILTLVIPALSLVSSGNTYFDGGLMACCHFFFISSYINTKYDF
jgi:hypothetical protein